MAGAARITRVSDIHGPSRLGSNSISLPNPRESAAKSANLKRGTATTKPSDFQLFLTTTERPLKNSYVANPIVSSEFVRRQSSAIRVRALVDHAWSSHVRAAPVPREEGQSG